MTLRSEIERRLEELQVEYRKVYSLLSMMEKGTGHADLVKLREEKLDPIGEEIRELKEELSKIP